MLVCFENINSAILYHSNSTFADLYVLAPPAFFAIFISFFAVDFFIILVLHDTTNLYLSISSYYYSSYYSSYSYYSSSYSSDSSFFEGLGFFSYSLCSPVYISTDLIRCNFIPKLLHVLFALAIPSSMSSSSDESSVKSSQIIYPNTICLPDI